MACKFRRIGA
ncbi:uncharacterized protein ARMOST_13393 [Armillaria ostoyae]|uniref:Uncharacterized protein n=1 Tax=Armillaria ostoyae TaxID=47428 RepID=A0A284RMQ9_ARMOS|nr:uncharacterized protein ARMOST_13393 [Armillaria ostoyae]